MEKQAQLIIPPKIRVGFRERPDTYKQILGFVVRLNEKGEQTNLNAWEGWRDKKLPPKDFKNDPTEGFVLNKGVGGARRSYGWNARVEKVRVHDPRGWEIEIDVDNLLNILKECDCSRGKGLEGKFVYAWNKQQLILLPVGCLDYENSKKYTELQGKGVGVKELIAGATYTTKKQQDLVYLGRFDHHFLLEMRNHYEYVGDTRQYILGPSVKADAKGYHKCFVFWNGTNFVYLKDVKSIAVLKSEAVSPDYADLVDQYNKSAHGSKVVRLFLKEVAESKKPEEHYHYHDDPWYFEDTDGSFIECQSNYDNSWNGNTQKYEKGKIKSITAQHRYYINKDGVFTQEPCNKTVTKQHPPTTLRLFAETENGSKIRVDRVEHEEGSRYYYNRNNFAKEL